MTTERDNAVGALLDELWDNMETIGDDSMLTRPQLRSALQRAALLTAAPRCGTEAWQPIETAPKDGTKVLVKLRDDVFPAVRPKREDLEPWNGIVAVMKNNGGSLDWHFAAPVGSGGFPDEWMVGWQPLPEPPKIDEALVSLGVRK